MKKVYCFAILLLTFSVNAQYSNYYIQSNVNANINNNVSGVIHEYKTIRNIDYGALSLANAQNEKNKIELLKLTDAKEKEIATSIFNNPLKAYDYGQMLNFCISDKKSMDKTKRKEFQAMSNMKDFCMSYVIPNNLIFSYVSAGRLQNRSEEGVITDIIFNAPFYNKDNVLIDLEKQYRFDDIAVGNSFKSLDSNGQEVECYLHQKELKRGEVAGVKGYKSTIKLEDDYEYAITDNYVSLNKSIGNGYVTIVKVRFYGDKESISFEMLEGRRYYLNSLIEKIISTIRIYDIKI